ncbi:MAG: RsmE family RNA methyltransferase [Gemmatimonadota bacterium]|nr:RsmE family RNA methyltransferase [Gemmatimonadota bacterium]
MTKFFSPESFSVGVPLTLGAEAARHAQVTRLFAGAIVGLRDGAGMKGTGTMFRISKSMVTIDVTDARSVERPPAVHLLPPVADRDRMLWLGEKAAEFGVATWRPVLWRRSKSVSPKGEGPTFQRKLAARMVSAMLQSGGAWLPEIFPEATVESALAATPAGSRILLDATAGEQGVGAISAPVSIAVGPEGGLESDERLAFLAANYQPLTLAGTTLRFETAGVGGIAVVMSRLTSMGRTDG